MSTRILILGSTGPSGILLTRETLAANPSSTVVLYVRSPQKVPADLSANESVTIIEGQLTDRESLSKAIQGVDAVLSVLGPGPGHPAGTPLAHAFELVIELMHEHNVSRLIALATGSVTDPLDKPNWKFRLLVAGISTFAKTAYQDIIAIGEVIRSKGADLDYTIVRVPILTNNASKEVVAGYIGDGKTGTLLSRAGIADFYVKELEARVWVKKAPLISSA